MSDTEEAILAVGQMWWWEKQINRSLVQYQSKESMIRHFNAWRWILMKLMCIEYNAHLNPNADGV